MFRVPGFSTCDFFVGVLFQKNKKYSHLRDLSLPLVPFLTESIIPQVRQTMLYFSVGVCMNRKERSALEIFASIVIFIRHPRNEKRTCAEMRPAVVSGIIVIFPVSSNSPRSLCEC